MLFCAIFIFISLIRAEISVSQSFSTVAEPATGVRMWQPTDSVADFFQCAVELECSLGEDPESSNDTPLQYLVMSNFEFDPPIGILRVICVCVAQICHSSVRCHNKRHRDVIYL